MKISGNCYIAKKFGEKEKDFEKKGGIGVGKIKWVDSIKESNGDTYKSYTTKRIVCFADNIDLIYAYRNDLLYIEGFLKTKQYKKKDGSQASIEEISITKVCRAGSDLVTISPDGILGVKPMAWH